MRRVQRRSSLLLANATDVPKMALLTSLVSLSCPSFYRGARQSTNSSRSITFHNTSLINTGRCYHSTPEAAEQRSASHPERTARDDGGQDGVSGVHPDERMERSNPTEGSPTSGKEAGDEEAEELPPPQHVQDEKLIHVLRDAIPLSNTDDIKAMLKGAKNAQEVQYIMTNIAYKHHLCFDVLNGHGYRVAVLQALTTVAPHTCSMHAWFDCVDRFRRLGFVLTRTFAAEGFTTLRQWLSNQFNRDGRSPTILTEGTAHIRALMHWCREDRLVFDLVLYTRIVFLLTTIVSFFDRQNVYRSTFSADFTKRDGIVAEWVISNRRCVDFDECVLQCDALLEEVVELLRQDVPSRPNFSIMYRLMDYYFATDNVEKLIATMEDAHSYGISVAESSTAKLMQLACATNQPNVPELFMRWRVALAPCVLATPDMSRLLFYYARSGGGKPCPVCGEPYNHRHVSVYCWMQTPAHQRQCPALAMARVQKGALEECRSLPQNHDWSRVAFSLWRLSRARAIAWGTVEWRAFLLCCMFSPAAMQAKALLDQHFHHSHMDDFLRATYVRLLRHHAPELAAGVLQQWQQNQYKMSPIALQEALMASVVVADPAARLRSLKQAWSAIMAKDSYVMPLTKRFVQCRYDALVAAGAVSPEEKELLTQIIAMQPRRVSLLDMKDSASDFVVGLTKKNVYTPPAARRQPQSRRTTTGKT